MSAKINEMEDDEKKEELHLFPVKENPKRHKLDASCPCGPCITPGYEEEGEDFSEVEIFRHHRTH